MADTRSAAPQAPAALRQAEPVEPAVVGRLLGAMPAASGAAAPPPDAASRFQLTGVVAGVSGAGAALISVDGRPPKPFAVGSRVDEGVFLQSVQGRRALLGAQPRGDASFTLEVPALPR